MQIILANNTFVREKQDDDDDNDEERNEDEYNSHAIEMEIQFECIDLYILPLAEREREEMWMDAMT